LTRLFQMRRQVMRSFGSRRRCSKALARRRFFSRSMRCLSLSSGREVRAVSEPEKNAERRRSKISKILCDPGDTLYITSIAIIARVLDHGRLQTRSGEGTPGAYNWVKEEHWTWKNCGDCVS